ncbi:MAG: hypothetical protein JOZ69_06515 [Myxococcales bacterium]|nr:hypothetical protein [Myxococcales bacterium]
MGVVAKRIGELLVEGGVLSQPQLEQALFAQRKDGRKLGQLLIELGLVGEVQLTQTLSRQLSVPWVSLYHVDFSRSLLNLVSRAVAEKYSLVPIFVRRVRNQGETLYVAMDDPTSEGALEEVARAASLPVKPMIACPSDIRAAIRVYYLGEAAPASGPSASGSGSGGNPQIIPMPSPAAQAIARVESAVPAAGPLVAPPLRPLAEVARPVASNPASSGSGSGSGSGAGAGPTGSAAQSPGAGVSLVQPGAAASQAQSPVAAAATGTSSNGPATGVSASMPPTEADGESPGGDGASPDGVPRKMRPRMISLTLLDGTTIGVPAPKKRPPSPDANGAAAADVSDQFTARDLVSALRAVAHGADASEILGSEPQWEAMFSALLSILLRKGLIADWEFVEEFRKI